jgi:hypothetical protein
MGGQPHVSANRNFGSFTLPCSGSNVIHHFQVAQTQKIKSPEFCHPSNQNYAFQTIIEVPE